MERVNCEGLQSGPSSKQVSCELCAASNPLMKSPLYRRYMIPNLHSFANCH